MATSKRLNSGDVRRLKRSLDITAFYDLPLDDAQIVVSAGSTSNSVSELVFADGGNISFGLNGSTLTATVAGGPPGPPGPPGPSVTIFDYRADTSIVVGYPGDGHIRWDNATQINSGTLRISHLTDGNVDIDRILSLLVAGQDLILQDANASANYQEWKVSGAPTNFNPGAANSYWDIPVSLITSAGTGTTNFPNNHQIILEIIRVGPPGPAGSITVSAGTLSSQASHLTFVNSNGVSWGFDGSNITATVATNYQSQGAYLTTAMASNRGSDFVQANATFHGTNASGTIASDGISVSVAAASASINISAGSTSSNVSAITFSNGSGVSFGFDGSNVTASVQTNYQTPGAYLTTAALSQDSSKYAGTNGSVETTSGTDLALTLNTSGATIAYPKWLTTAMASNAATISNINVSAGTTSNNLSAIKFADTIGLSFGLSGSTITGAPAIGVSAGTLAATLGGYTFSNSNNVSFGQAVGGTITATVASSLTNIKISAGASSGNVSALTFSNGSGVSFGFDGSNITATVATNYQSQGAYLTTAALSQDSSKYAGTNTSVQTTSGTDLSCALNTSGLTIAYPKWLTAAPGAGTGFTSTSTAGALITAALGTNGLSMAVPNYLTTAAATNDSSNNLGLNTSVATTAGTDLAMTGNSSGLTIGYPKWITTAAQTSAMASYFENMPILDAGSTTLSASGSVLQVVPFVLPYAISAGFLRVPVSMSYVSTEVSGTTANSTWTVNRSYTDAAAIMVQKGGASSLSLQYLTSSQATWVFQNQIGAGANGSRYTVTQNVTYPVSGTTSNYTTSYPQSSANVQLSSASLTLFTGLRWLDIPLGFSLSAGNYWLALGRSTNSATQAGNAALGGASEGFSYVGVSQNNVTICFPGAVTNSSCQLQPGLGSWSTNSAVMSTSSLQLASISAMSSGAKPYFQIIRYA